MHYFNDENISVKGRARQTHLQFQFVWDFFEESYTIVIAVKNRRHDKKECVMFSKCMSTMGKKLITLLKLLGSMSAIILAV